MKTNYLLVYLLASFFIVGCTAGQKIFNLPVGNSPSGTVYPAPAAQDSAKLKSTGQYGIDSTRAKKK